MPTDKYGLPKVTILTPGAAVAVVEKFVTMQQIQDIVYQLNEVNEEDPMYVPLTFDEVVGNKRLLTYVLEQAFCDIIGLDDPDEAWNMDCWCEIDQFRNL